LGRYVIYGAGAIGALVGAKLRQAGRDVLLIARGAHGEALGRDGVRVRTPEGETAVATRVANDIGAADLRSDDTLVLAMKTHQAGAAIERLAAAAPLGLGVVCTQNGIEAERIALRFFEHVYGALVYVTAAQGDPGVVHLYTHPTCGVVDVGRYPDGLDAGAARIAADLTAAGFDSAARPDVMAWKRGKLVLNTVNGLDAICAPLDDLHAVIRRARTEAEACFAAAGLDFVPRRELYLRTAAHPQVETVAGLVWPGSSTTQSLLRGDQATEADYLNGEIVRLGRTYGVATPVNVVLQQLVREMASAGAPAQSMSPQAVLLRLRAAGVTDL
jgi:2-dehydropantoate 2-reductase